VARNCCLLTELFIVISVFLEILVPDLTDDLEACIRGESSLGFRFIVF
jgi:hypothetical protein